MKKIKKDLITLLSEKHSALRKHCSQLWMAQSEIKLSASEWYLLNQISGQMVSVAEVGRLLGVSRQAVHKFTHNLIEKDLIATVELPDKKRDKYIRLTDLGEDCNKKYKRLALQLERRVAHSIGEENIQLLKVLLDEDWLEPAGVLSYTAVKD